METEQTTRRTAVRATQAFLRERVPSWLRRSTMLFLLAWASTFVLQLAGGILDWIVLAVTVFAWPLGVCWLRWARQPGMPRGAMAIVITIGYPCWWHAAVEATAWLGLHGLRSGLLTLGMIGLFLIGLVWLVWSLERASRRIELARIEEILSHGLSVSPHEAVESLPVRWSWNPLDPQAWYYGRKSRKLKQSTLALVTYASLFWIAVMIVSQTQGCRREYEMPAGGGQQKTVAQTVRVQKVIRKKFVVNPYSAIKFQVPPIDEVKLQLQEITAHQYTIGHGEGTGAGFAGGTSKGKVRLIRLEYDGGDWDLNFGIGGDINMLLEYGILTQQKVAERTESLRISQLASFPREKSPPVLFLTGQKSLSVSQNEVKTLRDYLRDKHGMLFASSGSPHFHNQFMSLMSRVLPDVRPVSVPLDDTIHRVPFAVPTLPYVVPHGGKDALGWSADGRWLVYYHPGDISDAWADGHAGVSRDIYDACYQLGANVINYAHVEYSKWLTTKGPKP